MCMRPTSHSQGEHDFCVSKWAFYHCLSLPLSIWRVDQCSLWMAETTKKQRKTGIFCERNWIDEVIVCFFCLQLKIAKQVERHDDKTHHGVVGAAGYREVGSRGSRGVDARGWPAASSFCGPIGTFWARLHRSICRFRRVWPRNGGLRAGDWVRVHRTHEHARVHTGNSDAHRLLGDLSSERFLPGGQLRDGSVRSVQLERRQQSR